MARCCYRWVTEAKPWYTKHAGPWITDNFGNSVRVKWPQLMWFHGNAGPFRAQRNNPWRGKM
jgi:hypothetical protein